MKPSVILTTLLAALAPAALGQTCEVYEHVKAAGGTIQLGDGGALYSDGSNNTPDGTRAVALSTGGVLIGSSRGTTVAGAYAYAPYLMRLQPDREIAWAREVGARPGWYTWFRDIALTPDGGAIVAALSRPVEPSDTLSSLESRPVIVGVRPDGTERWVRTIDNPFDDDDVNAVVVDGGIAYVYGRADTEQGWKTVVYAFGADGNRLWTTVLPPLGDTNYGHARHAAVRPGGGVIVTGVDLVGVPGENSLVIRTSAIGPDGTVLWDVNWGEGRLGDPFPRDLAVGPDGSVFVVGSGSIGDTPYGFLLAYTRDGELRWHVTPEGTAPTEGYVEGYGVAVAVAPDGNAVVSGHRWDNAAGGHRLYLARFRADGAVEWRTEGETSPYPLPRCATVLGVDLELTPNGRIYTASAVGGPLSRGNAGDILVNAYTSDGVWQGGAVEPVGPVVAYFDLVTVDTGVLVAGNATFPDATFVYAYWFDDSAAVSTAPAPTDRSMPVSLWPNPVSNILQIRSGSAAPVSLRLVDTLGRVVLSVPDVRTQRDINVSGLAPGVYFAVFEDLTDSWTRAVSVAR